MMMLTALRSTSLPMFSRVQSKAPIIRFGASDEFKGQKPFSSRVITESGADCKQAHQFALALVEHERGFSPNEEMQSGYWRSIEKLLDTPGTRGVFIFSGNTPIGMGLIHRNPKYFDDSTRVVSYVYIDPKFQHQGAGMLLLETLKTEASKDAVKRLVLVTRDAHNVPFYEKSGFGIYEANSDKENKWKDSFNRVDPTSPIITMQCNL